MSVFNISTRFWLIKGLLCQFWISDGKFYPWFSSPFAWPVHLYQYLWLPRKLSDSFLCFHCHSGDSWGEWIKPYSMLHLTSYMCSSLTLHHNVEMCHIPIMFQSKKKCTRISQSLLTEALQDNSWQRLCAVGETAGCKKTAVRTLTQPESANMLVLWDSCNCSSLPGWHTARLHIPRWHLQSVMIFHLRRRTLFCSDARCAWQGFGWASAGRGFHSLPLSELCRFTIMKKLIWGPQ